MYIRTFQKNENLKKKSKFENENLKKKINIGKKSKNFQKNENLKKRANLKTK